MIGKGIFEREIGDRKVGFKFGTYAAGVSEQESGESIFQIFRKIESKESIVMSLLYYFYGGAVAYCKKYNLEKPSIDEVADWLEELGLDVCMQIFNESLLQPKNVKAPEKTGQNQT